MKVLYGTIVAYITHTQSALIESSKNDAAQDPAELTRMRPELRLLLLVNVSLPLDYDPPRGSTK